MNGRSKLINLGDEFPRLTEKERDVLIVVHPYLDGMTWEEAAIELGISVNAVGSRMTSIYKKIPWLQEDMRAKRAEINNIKRNIEYPIRLGNFKEVSCGVDGETFCGKKILRKF